MNGARTQSEEKAYRRGQVAAIVALLAFVVVLGMLIGFLVRHFGDLLIGLAGFALAVGGGWMVLAERGFRRAIGVVVALAGLALMGWAFARAISGSDSVLLRIVLVVAFFAVAVGAARVAMLEAVKQVRVEVRAVTAPRHPVLLCNPWSGGGKVEKFGLLDVARSLGVETVLLDHGLDLEQLARDAVARGADCLGMAGGDGSQALVASIAVEHNLPFVCISAGTRNHFALDLGLNRDDPRETMYAFRDAIERRIDYGLVNGRFFVNNVSLGVYAKIVQEDSYRDAKVETTRSLLPEMLGSQSEPFDLQFTKPDGTEVDGVILIMVSNNPYVIGASPDAAQRRILDSGRLGVFAVSTRTGSEAANLMALSAVGMRRKSPYWHEFATHDFEVRSREGTAFAGIDGEALQLDTPLRFTIESRGLRLLVPAGNIEIARQREARQVQVGDLFTAAAGRNGKP
jgi:diacylglycerol kinase family enzyme